MINYNRLGYEIKRDLMNFSSKISAGLTKPKSKFVAQVLYGILSGNKVHLSEIARSLSETIPLRKTIGRLSRNLFAFGEKETVMGNYVSLIKKQQFELEDLRVMSLQSIRNLNLFATLAVGYIGVMNSEKEDTIFMLELKECSKRIYGMPKFVFYALGYAIGRVLARTRSGIKGFFLKKGQSQQLTLAQCFGMEAFW